MRLRPFLNQPVRVFNTDKKKWIYIITTMLFVAFFILFYTPFGINEEMEKPTTSIWRIISFIGSEVISIGIVLYIFQFYILQFYPNKTMRLKKYFNFFLLQMLCISILQNTIDTITEYHFFPEEFLNQEPDDFIDQFVEENTPIDFILDSILTVIPQVFILSYPFMGCLLYFSITDLKEEVNELECELQSFKSKYKKQKNDHIPIELLDENNQLEFTLNLDQILAFESSNQYVLLYYLDNNNAINKQIIRTRLKKILNELSHTPTIQCHRSYAVNLLNVEQLKRIDKKSYLTLSETDQLKIPVSKTYISDIKNRLVKPE